MLKPSDPGEKKPAAFRRKEQVDRWVNSSTDQQPGHRKEFVAKVRFDRGTVFLAACGQCDKKEVLELLKKGVDPNTANIDGLTGLHQACIDDRLPMVECLVENGASINVRDNEGWTPLHATASCGYNDVAGFLINKGADIAACNADGDLPIDLAEGVDMENLLATSMNVQSVNADVARKAEETNMLNDANHWLQHPEMPEYENGRTGATPLHVAAVKGYHNVMTALIQAGASVNHQDFDGWTPLHAAAHWGQEESCKILLEANCGMQIRDRSGLTAVDVADRNMAKLLKELIERKQAIDQEKDALESSNLISKMVPIKRRPSVTRMSNEDKERVSHNSALEEKAAVMAVKINEEDQEIEEIKVNDEMKEDEPAAPVTAEEPEKAVGEPEKPVGKPENVVAEPEKTISPRKVVPEPRTAMEPPADTSKVEMRADRRKDTKSEDVNTTENHDTFDEGYIVTPPASCSLQSRLDRAASLPARLTNMMSPASSYLGLDYTGLNLYRKQQVQRRASGSDCETAVTSDPTSWRASLRKTGSASSVADTPSDKKGSNVVKSASASTVVSTVKSKIFKGLFSVKSKISRWNKRVREYKTPAAPSPAVPQSQVRTDNRRPFVSIRDQVHNRSSYPVAGKSEYIPYYKRQQMEREAKAKEEKEAANAAANGTSTPPMVRSDSEPDRTNSDRRISRFETPKRDDEGETNRKIKAKRARETRRSTQGVTQDDVKAAEATLKIAETGRNGSLTSMEPPITHPTAQTSSNGTSSSSSISNRNTNASVGQEESKEQSTEEPARRRAWGRSVSYDPPSPLGPRTSDTSATYSPRSQEEGRSSSFRKARDTIVSGGSASSVPDTLASSSAYSRYRNGEVEPSEPRTRFSWRGENKENGSNKAKDEEDDGDKDASNENEKKPRLLRSRRNRRERRSTGVINYEENEKNEEEKEQDTSEGRTENSAPSDSAANNSTGWASRPFTRRYGSTSDVPTQMAGNNSSERGDRSAYRDRYSRRTPTTALDTSSEVDYKAQCEELKAENSQLRDQVKNLGEELVKANKNAMNRSSVITDTSMADRRERRALERRISELEEEHSKMEALKQDNARLKEENGALIRVISKLSK